MKVAEAALMAHAAGISVVPIVSGGSKKPPFSWSKYQASLPTRDEIVSWFGASGYTGYAAVCGAVSGNLEVLDFDDAATYQTFLDTAEAIGLDALLNWIRWGYEERTPDGGAHLLYRCETVEGHLPLARRPVEGSPTPEILIETRGEGNCAILAPSNGNVHLSGRSWRLVSGGLDSIVTITPEERAELHRLARSFDEMPVEEVHVREPRGPREPGDTDRPGDAFREQHGTLETFRDIVEAHGWKLVFARGTVGYFRRPGKTEGISATFGHAGTDLFYVFTSSTEFEPGRGYNPFSVFTKLNHGEDWKSSARDLSWQGYGDPIITLHARQSSGGGSSDPPGSPPEEHETVSAVRPAFALTDMGNAERLAWDHGIDIRFCHTWNKWLVWDETRFAVDDIGAIEARAKTTVRAIYREAAEQSDDKLRDAIAKHAKTSEAAPRIRAMIDLLRSEPKIPVRPGDLDRDQFLLNCANGTLNLRSGTLRPHDRDDLITKRIATSYVPDASCPLFLAFLNTIMDGDHELVGFLQRAAGYSLTGSTVERVIFILHGGGKNGKSTLVEVLSAVLGDYALRTPTDTLLAKRDQGIPNDIARLQHLRFVYASEAEEGQRLAEAKIKDMTGGDTMTARFLHGEFFDFTPAFKLWFSTNHKPTIRGTDMAIWDRIRLIPFLVRIPPEEQDKHLRQKLIAESPGILAWAVNGCMDWQRSGLQEPEIVRAATREYRSEMDVIGGFIDEVCVIAPTAQVSSKGLYIAYKNWCEQSGERELTQTSFGRKMIERGFETKRVGHATVQTWMGIGLRSTES